MPISLLLTSLSAPLASLAAAFGRWNAVLRLEAVVMDRARGTFLVEWFGARLPRSNRRLSVVIDNLEALGERYREARSRSMGGQTGPNLLEPVAGMAGMAVGMFISPTGIVMYLYTKLRESMGPILAVLLTVLYSPIIVAEMTGLGTAAAVILLPIGLIAGIVYAAINAGDDNIRVLQFELLGDATRMVQSLTRFLNLLAGPREAIRNPLLRGILILFDRIAALFAQLIGAAAWVLTRVAPLILPTAIQFRAMQQLGAFTFDLARSLLVGAFDVLSRLWRSEEGGRAAPWRLLLAMFDHVMDMARRMVEGAGTVLSALGQQLGDRLATMANKATGHARLVADAATALISDIPLIRTFRAAAAMVTAVRSILGSGSGSAGRASPPPPSSGGAGAISQALAPAGIVTGLLNEPLPPSLSAAEVMVRDARASGKPVTSAWGPDFTESMAAPFELDPATQALSQRLIAPPASVFTGERRVISEELGGRTPEQGLEALRTHELRYRDLLYAVVGRVFPPLARAYIPELLGVFNAIDRYIYDRDVPEGEPPFPVRRLDDNGRLRPVVRRLVVRSSVGGDDVSLRNLAQALTTLMRRQDYFVPAA